MAEPRVEVEVNTDELHTLMDPALHAETERRIVRRALDIVVPLARREAPRRTGRSQPWIRGLMDQEGGRPIGWVRPVGLGFYLRYQQTGTKSRAEPIVPFRYQKNRRGLVKTFEPEAPYAPVEARTRGAFRALRFKIGGETLFRGSVKHRGVRPNPFLDRAAVAAEPEIAVAVDELVAAAFATKRHDG
jgi:hypothetical protein